MVALDATTGAIEWSTKLDGLPDGAATVSNDLVFTALFNGRLVALNRATGAVVFDQRLARTVNSSLAVAGDTVIVPEGGPKEKSAHGRSQIVAFTLRSS